MPGAATVILAMGQGRIAAAAINEYLAKKIKYKNCGDKTCRDDLLRQVRNTASVSLARRAVLLQQF
jgi:hypothetical protein